MVAAKTISWVLLFSIQQEEFFNVVNASRAIPPTLFHTFQKTELETLVFMKSYLNIFLPLGHDFWLRDENRVLRINLKQTYSVKVGSQALKP